MNDWWEQCDAPVKSQSPTLIAHCGLLSGTVTPEQRRIKRLCCYCLVDPLWVHRKREQAWGVWMFLADQQAGIPSGMLVTDQSDGGMGVGTGRWLGWGGGGSGGKSLLSSSSFRRPQKGSGCDWPCDCRGRSLGCCRTTRDSPCFWSAARSRPVPWRSGRPPSLWWTPSWWRWVRAPCSSSQDCGGNAPRSPGHRLCWLKKCKEKSFSSHNKKGNISKTHLCKIQWAIYCLASVQTVVLCILGQWKNTNSDIYFTHSLQFFYIKSPF